MKISASIMCADLTNLEKECMRLELAGVDRLHIDIMDGHFVNNIVFGLPFVKELRKVTALPFEVHLVAYDPGKYMAYLLGCGVRYLCFHVEAARGIPDLLDRIRADGVRTGLALNPATPFSEALPFLPKLDLIDFMTVEPGFAGQAYDPSVVGKIREAKEVIDEKGLSIELESDGHMDETTIPEVTGSGVTVVVAGSSSLFGKPYGYREAVRRIRSWARPFGTTEETTR
jgi:ribulose-phosphate 3-epimerase